MAKLTYREEPAASESYRAGYLASVQTYLEKQQKHANQCRVAFMNPTSYAQDPQRYRQKFYEMLGAPLTEYHTLSKIPVACIENTLAADTGEVEIRRLRLAVYEDFVMYGILFLPHDRKENAPFVISQHGGAGTCELCSDFFGDSNYNHLTARLLARGAVVFAPQLLLWNPEFYGNNYDRQHIDNALKQVGSSITALEVFGIMRCLDYFVTQPYCNPDHIGMAGLSYGGFFTTMATAADVRIRAAYASCSLIDAVKYNNFRDWTWFGSANTFLEAEIAALAAPRAICFDAGERDELFGADSTRTEFARAQTFFAELGVEDHIALFVFDGTHELNPADDGMEFLFAHL